jgi:hypothetical protein
MKMDRFLVDSIRSFFIKAPRRRTVSPITKTPIVIFPPEKQRRDAAGVLSYTPGSAG